MLRILGYYKCMVNITAIIVASLTMISAILLMPLFTMICRGFSGFKLQF
jgi:hypothetical protein